MVIACNLDKERFLQFYEDILDAVKFDGKFFRLSDLVTITTRSHYVTRGTIEDINHKEISVLPSYSQKETVLLEDIVSIMY